MRCSIWNESHSEVDCPDCARGRKRAEILDKIIDEVLESFRSENNQ